jgi:putative ABC transport system permease protein
VARRIQSILPDGLRVEAVAQRKADLRTVLRSMQVLLQGVSLVALGAAFIIAFSRLSMCFAERTWQLGVLRALGVRRRAVWWELLKEASSSASRAWRSAARRHPPGPGAAAAGRDHHGAQLPHRRADRCADRAARGPARGRGARPRRRPGGGATAGVAAASVDVAETMRGPRHRAHRRRGAPGRYGDRRARGTRRRRDRRPARVRRAAAGLAASAALVALTVCGAGRSSRWRPASPRAGRCRASVRRQLALRMLRHDLRRAALAVATVGIGVGTVVWLALVAFSFERTAVRVFEQAMRADYVVSSAHTGAGALEMPVDDALADTLRGVDGVDAVIGVRLANWQHQGESVVLDAFDPEYFRNPAYGQWPLHGESVEGAWEAVADGRAVVVSSNFAQNMRVAVADTVTLATPRGPLPLLVAGITTDFASPRGTIEMSRALYRTYWDDARVTRFFVQGAGARGADPALRGRLQQRLAAVGGAWR